MRKAKSARRHNVLLGKDDVGKPKPNTRRLPRDGHTYGQPVFRDPEDASAGK